MGSPSIVPFLCPACAKAGTTVLEQMSSGDTVGLQWRCRNCNVSFAVEIDHPVTPTNDVAFRATPDRRKVVRSDRRG